MATPNIKVVFFISIIGGVLEKTENTVGRGKSGLEESKAKDENSKSFKGGHEYFGNFY